MLALLGTAFTVIFLAELGDKTLFMVLLLAARYPPRKVFGGAALAFLLHGLIAVGLGQVLVYLPHAVVRIGSAILFLFFGLLLLLRDLWRTSSADAEADGGTVARAARAPALASFTIIFLAEWGDMTQILSAAMVGENAARLGRGAASLAVFGGSVLGLWLGTALATVVGHKAGRWLPERWVRRAAGVSFLAVAAYTAFWQR